MFARLGFSTHLAKFFSKVPLPQVDISLSIVEDHYIPGCLYYPAGCHKDLSEDQITKAGPSINDHVQWWQVHIPINRNSIPAALTETTFKEKVETGLLMTPITQNTIVVIKIHVLSSQ